MRTLRITGATLLDDGFSLDLGPPEGTVHWNVSKIWRAVRKGVFGFPHRYPIEVAGANDWESGNLERSRVDWIKEHPRVLELPAIAIEKDELQLLCFCDGNHRIAARVELGLPDFRAWVVPCGVEKDYRAKFEWVTENGQFIEDAAPMDILPSARNRG